MSRIERKQAVSIGEVLQDFIRVNHLTKGLNTQRVFSAWDEVSGAAGFTKARFYRDGKLYITVDSSVVRSQLYFQKEALVEKMNAVLRDDGMFSKEEPAVSFIKELILK